MANLTAEEQDLLSAAGGSTAPATKYTPEEQDLLSAVQPVASTPSKFTAEEHDLLSASKVSNKEPVGMWLLDKVNPQLKGAVSSAIAEAQAAGLQPYVRSGYRTNAEQQYLWDTRFKNPATGKPRGMVAKPGTSNHEFANAVDIAEKSGKHNELAAIFEKHGLYRPHGVKDKVHFELRGTGRNPVSKLTSSVKLPRGFNTYSQMAGSIADSVGIPKDVFFALIHQESNWNPTATSKAGAMGLGQLMPGTARGLGVKNPFNPEQNLRGAATYLKQQFDTFGNWNLALAAYNSGPGNVRKAGNRVPNIRETQNYVPRIQGLRRLYESVGGTESLDSAFERFLRNDTTKSAAYLPPPGGAAPVPAKTPPVTMQRRGVLDTIGQALLTNAEQQQASNFQVVDTLDRANKAKNTVLNKLGTDIDQFAQTNKQIADGNKSLAAPVNPWARLVTDPSYRKEIGAAAKAGYTSKTGVPAKMLSNAVGEGQQFFPGISNENLTWAMDQIINLETDPINRVTGAAITKVLAPLAATPAGVAIIGKLSSLYSSAVTKVGATKPGAIAFRLGELIGAGPNVAIRKGFDSQYRPFEERKIQELGQVYREMRDFTKQLRVADVEIEDAVQIGKHPFFGENAGPIHVQVENYLRALGEGDLVSQQNISSTLTANGVPGDRIAEFARRIAALHDESVDLLRVFGTITSKTKLPTNTPGKVRANSLVKFFTEGLGRRQGQVLGEVGSTAGAGTDVALLRQGLFARRIELTAQDGEYVRPPKKTAYGYEVPTKPGWVKLPDAKTTQGKLLGRLAGQEVPVSVNDIIVRDLAKVEQLLKSSGKAPGFDPDIDVLQQTATRYLGPKWRQIVGATKRNLIARASTLFSNFMSNAAASELAAVRNDLPRDIIAKEFEAAKKEVRLFNKTGKMPKGVGSIDELSEHSTSFRDTQIATSNIAGQVTPEKVSGIEGRVYQVGPKRLIGPGNLKDAAASVYSKVVDTLPSLHGATEQTFKLALFKALRKSGMSPERAAKEVEKYLFDYSDRPALLELADRYGLWIFNAFPTKAFNLFIDTLVKRPDLVLKYPRLQQLMLEDPEIKKNYDKLPDYAKGPFTVPLGKSGKFVDLRRAHPLASSIATAKDVIEGKSPIPKDPAEAFATIAGHTVAGPVISALVNRRLMGEGTVPIYNEGAPKEHRSKAAIGQAVRGYLPGYIPDFERLKDSFQGVSTTNAKSASALSKVDALLKGGAGMITYKGETQPEKLKRLEPEIARRLEVAQNYVNSMDQVSQGSNLKGNRYDFKHVKDLQEIRKLRKGIEEYQRQLIYSGRVVDKSGNLTKEGKINLIDVVLFKQALLERAHQLEADASKGK